MTREEINEYHKKYYYAHREKLLKRYSELRYQRLGKLPRPKKVKEKKKRGKKPIYTDEERIARDKERMHSYYLAHKEKIKAYTSKWKKEHKERLAMYKHLQYMFSDDKEKARKIYSEWLEENKGK